MADFDGDWFAYYLAPRFSMTSLLCLTEPLRAANELAERELYRWTLHSRDGDPVMAVNGMSVSVQGDMIRDGALDAVVVCASYEPERAATYDLFTWLRWLDAHGVSVGAADTGSYLLALSGLLDHHRATIHWNSTEAFKLRFPRIEVTSRLYEFDGRRFTCAGATAGMDLMLHLIGLKHGRDFSTRISDHFLHGPIRAEDDRQRVLPTVRVGVHEPILDQTIEAMEANQEYPIPVRQLADRVGVHQRRLERIFQRCLGRSPKKYYQLLRLRTARRLLTGTNMPVGDVAIACGFASHSHFTKSYRAHFGHAPVSSRNLAHNSGHANEVAD